MRQPWRVAAACTGLLAAAPAGAELITGFSGAFAPGQWATTVSGTLNGSSRDAGSSVMTTGQLSITGDNASGSIAGSEAGCLGATYGFAGPCQIRAVRSTRPACAACRPARRSAGTSTAPTASTARLRWPSPRSRPDRRKCRSRGRSRSWAWD